MATKEAITGERRLRQSTTHYIDGAFVESHGRKSWTLSSRPTHSDCSVMLGDEEDTPGASPHSAPFCDLRPVNEEERAKILRRLHEAASAPYPMI